MASIITLRLGIHCSFHLTKTKHWHMTTFKSIKLNKYFPLTFLAFFYFSMFIPCSMSSYKIFQNYKLTVRCWFCFPLAYLNKQGHRINITRDNTNQKMTVTINGFLFRKEKTTGTGFVYWRCGAPRRFQYAFHK